MTSSPSVEPLVEILLSTFNGERYLEAFLQSVLDQDEGGWSLLVRDDGSRDGTVAILERWRSAHPHLIRIVTDPDPRNLGAVGSFSRLLEASRAPFIMLADQDDIWASDKLTVTSAAMRAREAVLGADTPILVHTDLSVVDGNLKVIAPSLWGYQGLVPAGAHPFSRLLVENIVWGCTAMLNRSLVDRVGTIPSGARHHDWWIAMVAGAFGEIVSVPKQTILWRRHGANDSEVSDIRRAAWRAVTGVSATRRRLRSLLDENRARARLFLDRYGADLQPRMRNAAQAFDSLSRGTALSRRLVILQHRLFFSSPVRNAGLLLFV